MTDESLPEVRHQLPNQLDLRQSLSALGIEHLEVTDERSVVIYRQSVLNVRVIDGTLSAATTIEVEMFDPPPPPSTDDPESIVDRFLEEISSSTGSGL